MMPEQRDRPPFGEASFGQRGAAMKTNDGPFSAADLPLLPDGKVYHLHLKTQDLAPNIILVGDPGRVPVIADAVLRSREVDVEHRGLRSITGMADDVRVSIVTSGMGTSSEEIVLQELAVLNEIDPATRMRRAQFPRLNIIRVGTSGGLQAETPLGTPIITRYAIGMDNAGLFYAAPYPDATASRLEGELARLMEIHSAPKSRFHGAIRPYVSRVHPDVERALCESARELGISAKVGITASNSGFFAAQGRDVARVPPSVLDLDKVLGNYDPLADGLRVENMEMEASLLSHVGEAIGYATGTICPVIANRRAETFKTDYEVDVRAASRIALLALQKLARQGPAR